MDKYEIINDLRYILNNPEEINKKTSSQRPAKYTQALSVAVMVLPTAKERTILGYLVENIGAKFYFTKTDSVGPAIRHAIEIIENMSFQSMRKLIA